MKFECLRDLYNLIAWLDHALSALTDTAVDKFMVIKNSFQQLQIHAAFIYYFIIMDNIWDNSSQCGSMPYNDNNNSRWWRPQM